MVTPNRAAADSHQRALPAGDCGLSSNVCAGHGADGIPDCHMPSTICDICLLLCASDLEELTMAFSFEVLATALSMTVLLFFISALICFPLVFIMAKAGEAEAPHGGPSRNINIQ